MSFCSLEYVVFLVIVVALYWMLPHSKRWILLLISSYVFYGCWSVKYLLLIFVITLLSFWIAKAIKKTEKHRKRYLAIGVASTLSLLFFFKYLNFAQTGIMRLCGYPQDVIDRTLWNIILPVGISFYSFQCISYMVDVYRRNAECEEHFGLYALYVSFFPQLVAGPIERSSGIIPQLRTRHVFDYEKFTYGLKLIAWGAFKKLLIADFFAFYVDTVYGGIGSKPGGSMLLAAALFSIQIYCDFSGYSDMARGSAALLGIRLMENFRAPYLAQTIHEFWRRWHISLSGWLRDYIYIPLGGNRGGMGKYIRNILITFGLSGLWHGADWTFVVWGLIHGVFQICEKYIKRQPSSKRFGTWMNRIITFAVVSFAWIFFRADSVRETGYIITHIFCGLGNIKTYIVDAYHGMLITKYAFLQMAVVLSVLFLYDYISLKADVIALVGKQRTGVRWFIYISFMSLFVISYLLWGKTGNQFIYFQF